MLYEVITLDLKDLKQWKNWDKQLKAEGKKFPSTEKFVEWIRLDPYDLRAKALSEILTLEEFGRILYHLIQRRGFLSSRKGNDDPTTLFEKGNPNENILPINVTKSEADLSSLGVITSYSIHYTKLYDISNGFVGLIYLWGYRT